MVKKKTEDLEKTRMKKTKSKKLGLLAYFYNTKGEKKQIELPKEIFNVSVKPKLLALAVRVYLINQRQGTASTKTRAEVSGSTRKIYRQKGTGRARHGDIKAPIFVGGGVVGGPKPKDYSLSLNKKQKKKAFFGALSLQYRENNLLFFDSSFLKITPKTKTFLSIWQKIGLKEEKTLIVFPKLEKNNLILSARNLPFISFEDCRNLNTYQILNHKKIIFLEDSLLVLKRIFLKDESK